MLKSMFVFAVIGSSVLAFGAIADLTDIHLDLVPRTSSERERIKRAAAPATDFSRPEKFESRPAGAATVRARSNSDAFSQPSGNIDFEGEMNFKVGNGLFKKLWVSSPSSTLASDGLGPLYNARSCQRCHLKDGRGHPPAGPGDNAVSMLISLSVPLDVEKASDTFADYKSSMPDPTYGNQLQDLSVAGQKAEYRLSISYEEFQVSLSGGEVASLRRPIYGVNELGYGSLHPDAVLSPRIAPQLIGMGLLEAIPAEDILANADPDDGDGDGVSGRPGVAWSLEFQRPMLGRFGWKASIPTVRHQAASAIANDIGISNSLLPDEWGDCTLVQMECRNAPHGEHKAQGGFELSDEALDLITFYSRNLGVPARRNLDDPQVLRGKELFYEADCVACHVPKFVTHRLADREEQSFQLIWPYTDLLLHDMGDELADRRADGAISNRREWRTPPLWGIGLTETVSGHTYFLHDGRARSLQEAILWHAGEAERSRSRYAEMSAEERASLLSFLESL